jgi:hypothetical protein
VNTRINNKIIIITKEEMHINVQNEIGMDATRNTQYKHILTSSMLKKM